MRELAPSNTRVPSGKTACKVVAAGVLMTVFPPFIVCSTCCGTSIAVNVSKPSFTSLSRCQGITSTTIATAAAAASAHIAALRLRRRRISVRCFASNAAHADCVSPADGKSPVASPRA